MDGKMDIDVSGPLSSMLDQSLKEARRLVQERKYEDASRKYLECGSLMEQYAHYASGKTVKMRRLEKARSYVDLAHQLRVNPEDALKPRKLDVPEQREVAKYEDVQFESVVSSFIDKTEVTWDEIGGLYEVKEQLKLTYGLGIARAKGVDLPKGQRICLYGPAGTGKTLIAAACSNHMESTFYNVHADDLLSKYFGESEKIISELFSQARIHSPSLIFVDDFDSLLRSREQDMSGAEVRVLEQFLIELDGLKTKNSNDMVMFIAATNMPWLFDKAIMSRFAGGFIYIPLPDVEAREQILKIHLRARGFEIYCNYRELAMKTEGYGGRELKDVAEESIRNMIRRANPKFTSIVDRGIQALRDYDLVISTIDNDDIDAALSKVKPLTDPVTIQRYESWEKTRST